MKIPCPYSWKKCTFAPVFSKRHHLLLLNYPVELRPRTRLYEQIQIHIGAAHHSADFNHSVFGAVAGLTGYMGRGLRFLYAFELVLSPTGCRNESNNKIITITKK